MAVDVRDGVAVLVCVAVGAMVGVRVISVNVSKRVGVIMTSGVGEPAALALTVRVLVDVGVADGVTVRVGDDVCVGVMLAVATNAALDVEVELEVDVEVEVGVAVGVDVPATSWAWLTSSGSVWKLAITSATSAHTRARRPDIAHARVPSRSAPCP